MKKDKLRIEKWRKSFREKFTWDSGHFNYLSWKGTDAELIEALETFIHNILSEQREDIKNVIRYSRDKIACSDIKKILEEIDEIN